MRKPYRRVSDFSHADNSAVTIGAIVRHQEINTIPNGNHSHARALREERRMLYLLIGLVMAALVFAFVVRTAWALSLPGLFLLVLLIWMLLVG